MNLLWRQPSIIIAILAASTSGVAILLYALGWVTLTYSLTFLAPLTAILFVALVIRSGRVWEDVFVNRLYGGLIAGAVGLVAYDVVRFLILISGLSSSNPFRPIEIYGLLILDRYEDSLLTKSVGWAFHIWNGLSFATMYTLAVGRGRVLWGLGWGLVLEVAMIITYPTIFQLMMAWEFVLVSLIGHIAYGLAIGFTARRVVKR